MIIIKRLFAEKILRYNENAGRFIMMLKRVPGIGKGVYTQVVDNGNNILKHIIGVLVQLVLLGWEFVKKLLFLIAFVWLPYRILANDCPLIAEQRTLTLMFLFFLICTVAGSIVNSVICVVDKRDYFMTRVVLISPAINSLGKVMYRMVTDFAFFALALYVIKLPMHVCLLLSLITMFARPIGEVLVVLMYEKARLLYNNRGAVFGTVMAVSLMAGYGVLYMTRTVSVFWHILVTPVFVIAIVVLGIISFLVLCNYRNYAGIVKDAIATK
ncbi:MAG: hypothetical protein IJB96_07300 [Lachnospira sp.]|nr:hypothetical protein [Lachnospira sp.]